MLQDIVNKNEIATDNSIKLIETSLTEIGADASTQTGGLTLRELQGLDKELRTISGSLRSAIAKAMTKQVDIDKENRKLEEMTNDERYSDEQKEEVRARLLTNTHFERPILKPNLSDKRVDHEILG